jgi:hypothetical protein
MVTLGSEDSMIQMSNQMCDFLSLPYSSSMYYLDMMTKIMNYCSEKHLFVGTKIKTTDPALNALLQINDSFDLNILTIHSCLERHIVNESELLG